VAQNSEIEGKSRWASPVLMTRRLAGLKESLNKGDISPLITLCPIAIAKDTAFRNKKRATIFFKHDAKKNSDDMLKEKVSPIDLQKLQTLKDDLYVMK